MKFALFSALVLAVCAQAQAASGSAASLKIEGSDRMHECLYSPELSGMDKGVVGITFTAGDADEYNYSVTISDESDAQDCSFVVRSQK